MPVGLSWFCVLYQVPVSLTISLLVSACLEAQHPLQGFLLSQRSLHCHVCLYIFKGRLAAPDIIRPREGGLRYWETMSDEMLGRIQVTTMPRMRAQVCMDCFNYTSPGELWLACYSPSVAPLVRKFFRKQNVFATVVWHLVVKWFVYVLELDKHCMCANMARYSITLMLLTQAESLIQTTVQ